ncbi:MAG: alpha-D-glucose phosphate-specific phosphoglucomutase [Tahibacter sp.]
MQNREVATQPYTDQKPGTAGLRKSVKVFQQPHYLENFLQSIFDTMPHWRGAAIVIGGDGRYFNDVAVQRAIAMAAANGVERVIVGQHGFLSTPAASHLIARSGAAGGLLLTASHNPAGPDGDFGIKFSIAGGGQAPESLTEQVYAASRVITRYRIAELAPVDLSRIGTVDAGGLRVDVVDPVMAYAELMQGIFDFDQIRAWLRTGHRLRFDAMHAITGPYAQRIFVDLLGARPDSVINGTPLPDFGGGHPDPNLIYARELVDALMAPDAPDFGAASDGDGDRNMILGRGMFVSPGDSLAMLAAHLQRIPKYRNGLRGVARSMPTSRAVDRVAKDKNIECFETPTGWKFFSNLLDAGRIDLCGEESFGTSSSHVREKDGVWAALAWLNILAATGLSVAQIAQQHWARYGRHYYARHDYEGLPVDLANELMCALQASLADRVGQRHGDYTITLADSFSYTDPIDGSVATQQGLRLVFGEAARIVVRLSGTGTSGATLRVYLEHYESAAGRLALEPNAVLAPLAQIALDIAGIVQRLGRDTPDVVT